MTNSMTFGRSGRKCSPGDSFDPGDPQSTNRIAAIDGEARGNWSQLNTSPDRTYLWSDLAIFKALISSAFRQLKAYGLI
jgi:hypothetical protein